MDVTLGLTATAWILITIALVALGWFVNVGMNAQQKKGVKVLAVASALILTVALGFWVSDIEAVPGDITGVTWGTSCTSDDSHVIKMADYTFKVLCVYDISDAALTSATEDVTLNFVNTRTDTEIIDATAICKITDYGTQTNSTTSQSYDGIERNTDGSYNVVFTNSAGDNTTNQIVVPTDKKSATDSFDLLLTPNANAIAAAPLYGGYLVTIVDAGQTYIIEFVHHETQA